MKPDSRELKIGSHGAYGGSSGIAAEDVREFMAEKLANGIFKAMPKDDLSSGQYTFCRMTQRPERFSTFGIRLVNDPKIEKLCASLKADKPDVIIDALQKLRGMGGPVTVPQILPCLKHRHPNVIRDACRTLAILGNKDVIPSIEPLLKHSKPDVRKDAQDAIFALNAKT
jgi:HEAT repeat protein